MGQIFTNFQLETNGMEQQTIMDGVISVLRQDDYFYAPDAADADFVVYLLTKPDARWTAMCMKDVQIMELHDLQRDAARYASAMETNAIGNLVFDSSLIVMILHSAVRNKTDLVIRPNDEICQEEFGFGPGTGDGNASVWHEAFGCDEEMLNAFWSREFVFAEEMLEDVGNLLGFADTAISVSEDVVENRIPQGYTRVVMPFVVAKDARRL